MKLKQKMKLLLPILLFTSAMGLLFQCSDTATGTPDPEYTVTYVDGVDTDNILTTQRIGVGKTATAPTVTDVANPNPICYTYNPAEWYTDETLTHKFSFSTAITADITLYAKWTLTTNTTPTDAGGDGYLDICTPAQLLYMESNSTTLSDKYELMADIRITNSTEFPIGGESNTFSGEFKGNHKTIRGLDLSDHTTNDYLGLFGAITSQARLSDFVLDHNGIGAEGNTGNSVGGIAGKITLPGPAGQVIKNVGVISTSGKAINGRNYVGGLVGWYTPNSKDGIVSGYNTSTIIGDTLVGGLVGRARGGGQVYGYNTGDITAKTYVGGLVGRISFTADSIVRGFSGAPITATSNGGIAGGLVGSIAADATVHGYFSGTIANVGPSSGGLVGKIEHSATLALSGYVLPTASITSTFTGDALVGGLYGSVNADATLTIQGYMRGNIASSNSTSTGKIGQQHTQNILGFYSSEVDVTRGNQTTNTTMEDGVLVDIATATQNSFSRSYADPNDNTQTITDSFTFGTDAGEWVFQAGKWPGIHLGLDEHFGVEVDGDDVSEQTLD